MVKPENQIIISLSDLFNTGKKHFVWFLIFILGCATLFLLQPLRAPLSYKAEGSLKIAEKTGSGLGAKLLSLGDSGGGYSANDDPKDFLSSYLVTERVVKKLNFQGNLVEKRNIRSNPIRNSLLAFKARRHFPASAPSTPFGAAEPCPQSAVLPFKTDSTAPAVKRLIFPHDYAVRLELFFHDNMVFEVKGIGQGKLGTPFTHDGFTFTLSGNNLPLQGREFILDLSPLHLATHVLQKGLDVSVDKKNKLLLNISCTHSNPRLAAQVVNAFMEEYQNYLRKQGADKISHQLTYLSKREEDVIGKLKTLTKAQGVFAQEEIKQGRFSLLGNPKTSSEIYLQACRQYTELGLEIQRLYEALNSLNRPVQQILAEIDSWSPSLHSDANSVTSHIGRVHLEQLSAQINELELDFEKQNNLCKLLDREDFELLVLNGALGSLLSDGEITRLSRYVSGANHTAKERAFAKEQLDTEKILIKERMANLQEQQLQDMQSLKDRLEVMQQRQLLSLAKELRIIESDVANYLVSCSEHVDQVLFEHNIFLNKEVLSKFHGELLVMAESKNLAYNLESLQTRPFELAKPPYLPEPPKLKKMGVVGVFIGIFLSLAFLVLREVYLGPTASRSNLQALGYKVFEKEPATFELLKGGQLLAVLSKQPNLELSLAKKLAASGKKLLLFYLSGKGPSCLEKCTIRKENNWSSLELGTVETFSVLQGKPFAQLLEDLKKEFETILFVVPPEARFVASDLVSRLLYIITDERISELEGLPSNTLYMHAENQELQKKTLKEMISSASFSLNQTSKT